MRVPTRASPGLQRPAAFASERNKLSTASLRPVSLCPALARAPCAHPYPIPNLDGTHSAKPQLCSQGFASLCTPPRNAPLRPALHPRSLRHSPAAAATFSSVALTARDAEFTTVGDTSLRAAPLSLAARFPRTPFLQARLEATRGKQATQLLRGLPARSSL